MIPCVSTVQICFEVEKVLQKYKYEGNEKMIGEIESNINTNFNFGDLYPLTDFNNHGTTNHKHALIRMIIKTYIRKKLNLLCRYTTQEKIGIFLRTRLKKQIHFAGQ